MDAMIFSNHFLLHAQNHTQMWWSLSFLLIFQNMHLSICWMCDTTWLIKCFCKEKRPWNKFNFKLAVCCPTFLSNAQISVFIIIIGSCLHEKGAKTLQRHFYYMKKIVCFFLSFMCGKALKLHESTFSYKNVPNLISFTFNQTSFVHF